MVTLNIFIFSFATLRADIELSVANIFSARFSREAVMAIQPVPVPTSRREFAFPLAFKRSIRSSVSALSVAKENMKIFNITNVQMSVHNFLHNRFKSKFDVVVSNPPYISVDDMSFLPKEVKDYDPPSALTDNADGLSFYRRFAEQFDNLLIPGGVLLLEFGGNSQKYDIEKIFNGAGLKTEFFKDLQKKWRVVEVYR